MVNSPLKVCVAAPPSLAVSETFIGAINAGLGDDALVIHGQDLNFSLNGLPISKCVQLKEQSTLRSVTALLPTFVGVRMRRKFLRPTSETETLTSFFQDQEIDVVLAHYGTQASCLVASCKAAGVALVPHFHGFDMSVHSVLEDHTSAYKDMFRYCHRLIAVSQRMKHDMIDFGCAPDRIRVVYYSPHPTFFDVTPAYRSNNLVMAGRLTDKKAPHLTLLAFAKAAEKFPNLRLRVIGDGDLRSVCRDLIDTLGISCKVDMLGAGDRNLIQQEFGNAFAFLQHSVRAFNGDCEGTPVAILEAGASGLPVVSTKHAGIPDVITSGAVSYTHLTLPTICSV